MPRTSSLLFSGLLAIATSTALAQGSTQSSSTPTVATACSNYREVFGQAGFPREAEALNLETGRVELEFTLTDDDRVENIRTLSATHQVFADISVKLLAKLQCKGNGRANQIRIVMQYQVSD